MRQPSQHICATCKQSITHFGGTWHHARAVKAKSCGKIPVPVERRSKSS